MRGRERNDSACQRKTIIILTVVHLSVCYLVQFSRCVCNTRITTSKKAGEIVQVSLRFPSIRLEMEHSNCFYNVYYCTKQEQKTTHCLEYAVNIMWRKALGMWSTTQTHHTKMVALYVLCSLIYFLARHPEKTWGISFFPVSLANLIFF